MNDRVFDMEADVVKKDGTLVPVFIYSNLIELQGKKVIQGIFRDISKEKIISDLKGELMRHCKPTLMLRLWREQQLIRH
jgi:hypothetical protein